MTMSGGPSELEELLSKLQEFERMHPAMSHDTRREFESMMRLVQKRLRNNTRSQAATAPE
jgi:hypothetical protein